MNDRMFILISTECMECGGKSAIMLLDHTPSNSEIGVNEIVLGSAFCIKTYFLEIKINGAPVITEERRSDHE